MIGRGLIADPFLPSMIRNDTTAYPENRLEIFSKFHDTIFHEYDEALSGHTQTILKMLGFWGYFSLSFSNPHKTFKKIKKAKNIHAYEDAVKSILNKEMATAE